MGSFTKVTISELCQNLAPDPAAKSSSRFVITRYLGSEELRSPIQQVWIQVTVFVAG
jgi:hypothetical protein